MKKILVLIMCGVLAASMLAGCGKKDEAAETETMVYNEETLQEMLSDESELMNSIADVAESCGMQVQITGNELRFTYTVSGIEDLSVDAEDIISSLFDTDLVQTTFEELKSVLVDATGCDITIYIDYVDSDGELIYENEF